MELTPTSLWDLCQKELVIRGTIGDEGTLLIKTYLYDPGSDMLVCLRYEQRNECPGNFMGGRMHPGWFARDTLGRLLASWQKNHPEVWQTDSPHICCGSTGTRRSADPHVLIASLNRFCVFLQWASDEGVSRNPDSYPYNTFHFKVKENEYPRLFFASVHQRLETLLVSKIPLW